MVCRPLLACLLLASPVAANPNFVFDDIRFWVGSGANRAAVAIDWDDSSSNDTSLVWGYRWDGSATGEDMLLAVLGADDRLYAKLGYQGSAGLGTYGIGYDLNNDDQFAITPSTTFDSNGIAMTGPADGATSNDPQDHYAEGWYVDGFWHYGTSENNPLAGGSWTSSLVGSSNRVLADGSWDSWAYSPLFCCYGFAENPQAAQPVLMADFEPDGDVDADDLATWKSGFGLTGATLQQGDANGDQVVAGLDFLEWQTSFGYSGPTLSIAIVPEPSLGVLVGGMATCFMLRCIYRPLTNRGLRRC